MLQLALKLGFRSVVYVLKCVLASKVVIICLGEDDLPIRLKVSRLFAVSSASTSKPGAA